MNPIQKLTQTEIKCLLEKSKGLDAITHNSTKGSLRENLLIDFFNKLIPKDLSITSGIICDASGKSSNQTDFIIYDNSVLPNILLDKNISVIPIEAVYLVAEIKSVLRKKDLNQVEIARKNFDTLELTSNPNTPQNNFKIPSVILAFDNIVSKNSLIQWMEKTNNIVSICIIGKFTLNRENNGIVSYENKVLDLPNYWETLNFCISLYNYLAITLKSRNILPLWGAYLQGVEKFKELNNID